MTHVSDEMAAELARAAAHRWSEESGYTPKFLAILNRIPRFDENGRDIAESTRRNMALHDWQRLEDGWKLLPVLGVIAWVEPNKKQ